MEHIRQQADNQDKYIFDKPVDVIDENGQLIARVVKTLYVRKKSDH